MILEKLYYGELCPAEKPATHNPRYIPLSREVDDLFEELKKQLSGSQVELLNEFYNHMYDLLDCEAESKFECGFAMGVQLLLKAINSPYLPEPAGPAE